MQILSNKKYLATLVTFFICIVVDVSSHQVPEMKYKRLYPRGFEVVMADAPGMELFAFHGKLNQQMIGLEAGTYSRDIRHKESKGWVFRDNTTLLKKGDIIYCWVYVLKYGLGYQKEYIYLKF